MNKLFYSIGINRLRMGIDGKGVTTLVAGCGCPLRCKYCINPQCFESPLQSYTVDELLEIVKIDDLYFQATDGGITFGGGEPLLQADFIHSFKQKINSNWKINCETSLHVPKENVYKVLEDIDCFIVDIKDMNSSIYQSYTGQDNTIVIENLNLLKNKNVHIRVPLIPAYNTKQDIKKSIESLKNMGFEDIEVFTYNLERGKKKRLM